MVPLHNNKKVFKTHGSKSRNRQRNYNTLETAKQTPTTRGATYSMEECICKTIHLIER